MTAEVIDLHEHFTVCSNCGEAVWYIQWDSRCTEVKQIVCAACSHIIENPGFGKQPEIVFEPDFDLTPTTE